MKGMLMTLADSSARKVDVVGPQGLTHFIAAMRKYVYRYVSRVFTTDLTQ